VGVHHQPHHLATPRRAGPALPDRPHRLGLPSDVEHLVLADTTTTADTDADSDEAGPLEDGPLEDTASDAEVRAEVDTEVGYVDVEADDV